MALTNTNLRTGTGTLNLATSWTPNAAPTDAMIGGWNSTSGTTGAVGASFTIGALQFAGTATTTVAATPGATMTIAGAVDPDDSARYFITSAAAASAITFTLNNALSFTGDGIVNTANNIGVLFGGGVTATGTITKNGPGYLYPTTTTNAGWTGPITVNSGSLIAPTNATSALGTGRITYNGAGSLLNASSTAAATFPNALTLNGDLTIGQVSTTAALVLNGDINFGATRRTIQANISTGTLQLTGVLSGSAGFTTAGGNFWLTGSKTGAFTGGTAVLGSSVILATTAWGGVSNNALAGLDVVDVSSGAGLYIQTLNSWTTNTKYVGSASTGGMVFYTSAAGQSVTFTNPDAFKGLTAERTPNSTDPTGGLSLCGTTAAHGNGTALTLQDFPTTVSFRIDTATAPATITYAGAGGSFATNSFVIYRNGAWTPTITYNANGTGALTLSGWASNGTAFSSTGSAGTGTLVLSGTSAPNLDNTISGKITNPAGTLNITKSGANTWVLAGDNTYTGATTISAGTLKIGHNNALKNSTTNYNAGTLSINSDVTAPVIGALAGTGTGVTLAIPAGTTVTAGGNNATTSYVGKLSGAGTFTKAGTGTLTSTTASPDFTGVVNVAGGYIQTGTVNGGAANGNIYPASTGLVLTGQRIVYHGANPAYSVPAMSGSGTYFISQSSTATYAANGVTFNDLTDFTGTLYLWGNQFTQNYGAHVGILKFPAAAATLSFNSGSGGGSPGDFATVEIPAAATARTTPTRILIEGYASSLVGKLHAIYANQSTGAMVFTGTISRGAAGTNTAATVTLGGSNTEDNEWAGVISGGTTSFLIGITKTGTGTWVLSNTANTYINGTRPQQGMLKIRGATTVQNSPLWLESGDTGTLLFESAAGVPATAATVGGLIQQTAGRDWAIPAGMTLTLNNAYNYGYTGVLSGTSDIIKTGTADQAFSRANTVSGALTINAGSITAGMGGTTGSLDNLLRITVNGTAAYSINRTNAVTHVVPVYGAGSVHNWNTGGVTFNAGTLENFTGTLGINGAGGITTQETTDETLTSITGTGAGAWTKTGGGKVTLGAGTHTGAWNINGGELVASGDIAAASGLITIGTPSKLTGTGAIRKPVSISAGSTGNDFTVGGASAVTVNGTAVVNGNTTGAVTVGSTGAATINGNTGTLYYAGTGAVLSPTVNTTPNVQANGTVPSTLTLPANRRISSGSNSNVPNSATAAAAALYQTGANSVFENTTSDASGAVVQYFGAGGAYGYYLGKAGTVTNRNYFGEGGDAVIDFAGVTADLDRIGGGFTKTVATTSTTNVLSGNVAIGTFRTGASGQHPGNYIAFNVDGYTGTALNTTAWIYSNGNSYTVDFNVVRGARLGLSYSVSTQPTFRTNIWGGTLEISGTTATTTGTNTKNPNFYGSGNKLGAVSGTAIYTYPISPPAGHGVYSVNLVNGGSGYIGPPALKITTTGSGTGACARAVLDLDPASPTYQKITAVIITSPGTGYAPGDTITVVPVGGGGTGFSATIGNDNLALNTSTSAPASYSPDMEFAGGGTLNLAANNTYTGASTISSGTLNIGNNATAGTIGPSSAESGYGTSNAILSGGTLGFNRNENLTYAGTISGTSTSGGLSKPATTTAITATISGNNTFLAPISVAGGTLRAAHVNAFGSSAATTNITVTAGAADFHAGAGTSITSARGFSIAGTGVAGGALRVTSGSVTLNGNGALTAAASVDADTGASLTLNGVTSGGFTFTKGASAGTVTLGGLNTFTGAVTVSGGTLSYRWASNNGVAGGLGAGSASVTVANGATLDYSGVISGSTNRVVALSTAAAGEGALSASGAAPITYTAAPTITKSGTAGTLKTLVLRGTAQNANKIDAVIAEPTGTGNFAIAKRDGGTWVLSKANTFTSNVSVEGGTLVAAAEDGTGRFGTVTGSTQVVSVESGAKIQTLTGTTQRGRHQYNNLTFKAGSRIRIGGTISGGAIQMNGDLNLSGLTAGQKVTWNLTDPMYKVGGTYDLLVFVSGTLSLPGGAAPATATLSDYITVVPPVGRNATLAWVPAAGGTPAKITVQITIA